MRYPFDECRLGTRYGAKGSYWRCGWHSGLDLLSLNYGGDGLVHPLYAGKVERVAESAAYGKYVLVRHADGYVTLYAHLRLVYARRGMTVGEDAVLGVEGATGNATGRHLHLEVHKGDYSYPAGIDPLEFIKKGMESEEVEKNIDIKLNGRRRVVAAIVKHGHNYVRLQDLRDEKIFVGYDDVNKVATIEARG